MAAAAAERSGGGEGGGGGEGQGEGEGGRGGEGGRSEPVRACRLAGARRCDFQIWDRSFIHKSGAESVLRASVGADRAVKGSQSRATSSRAPFSE